MFEVTIQSPLYVPPSTSTDSPQFHRSSMSQFNFERGSQENKDISGGLIGLFALSNIQVPQIVSKHTTPSTNNNDTEGRVSVDIAHSATLPSYPNINQKNACPATIDEIALPLPHSQAGRSSVQTPRPTNQNVKLIRSTQLFHYARMYRRLSTKGLLKLTIQEICKMAFIHKLLTRHVVKRRVSTASRYSADGTAMPNEFTLGSIEFELVGERQQTFLQRLHGYMYDWWASIFLKEDFGAIYYNDWRYISIKVGK